MLCTIPFGSKGSGASVVTHVNAGAFFTTNDVDGEPDIEIDCVPPADVYDKPEGLSRKLTVPTLPIGLYCMPYHCIPVLQTMLNPPVPMIAVGDVEVAGVVLRLGGGGIGLIGMVARNESPLALNSPALTIAL